MIRDDLDGLVCDMDGVLYRGDRPIARSAEAIAYLRDAGVRIVFCTNNSRNTVAQYIDKLERVGVEAQPEEIVTSAIVTAEVLAERGFAGKTAFVVGGDGIRDALDDVCISVKDDLAVTRTDVVVVGFDPTFTYEIMRRAADAARAGAAFVATNGDASFPAPEGLWPGAGSILASIETAAGRKAEVIGKPHPPMYRIVARRLEGCERIAVVGDRPDTDLAGAHTQGWRAVLVLSGVTPSDEVAGLDPQPDGVFENLAEFVSSLQSG